MSQVGIVLAGGAGRLTPEQARRFGQTLDWTLWAVTGLVCLFSLVNVHDVARAHHVDDPQAWLLAPIVDIALIAALRADSVLSVNGVGPGRWAAALRWTAGISTWALNVWDAVVPTPGRPHVVDPGAIITHSVPPVVLILLAEAAVAYRRRFAVLAARGDAEVDALRRAEDAVRQAEADLAETRAELDRVDAELAAARERAETERAERERLAGELTETRERARVELEAAAAVTEAMRDERDQASAALTQARAELEELASREAARTASGKGAGKDAGRITALSAWTADATPVELAGLAAVLESVQLRRTGRRLTYSAAQRALGVRYDAAKAALDAAREASREDVGMPIGSVLDGGVADAEIVPLPSQPGRRELEPGRVGAGAR